MTIREIRILFGYTEIHNKKEDSYIVEKSSTYTSEAYICELQKMTLLNLLLFYILVLSEQIYRATERCIDKLFDLIYFEISRIKYYQNMEIPDIYGNAVNIFGHCYHKY